MAGTGGAGLGLGGLGPPEEVEIGNSLEGQLGQRTWPAAQMPGSGEAGGEPRGLEDGTPASSPGGWPPRCGRAAGGSVQARRMQRHAHGGARVQSCSRCLKRRRPCHEAEAACAPGMFIFLQQMCYLLMADPAGRLDPQRLQLGKGTGAPPHPPPRSGSGPGPTFSHVGTLERHDAWAPFQSNHTRLGTGSDRGCSHCPRLPAAAKVAKRGTREETEAWASASCPSHSSSGWAGTGPHQTLSCLAVT